MIIKLYYNLIQNGRSHTCFRDFYDTLFLNKQCQLMNVILIIPEQSLIFTYIHSFRYTTDHIQCNQCHEVYLRNLQYC